MRILRSVPFICSTGASSKRRKKPVSEPDLEAFVHTSWEDIRYGARMLWKHRLATIVCAAALALGIGANTAMFSVAEAFLVHSVPFENPDRIVAMVDVRPQQNIDRNAVAPATYLDWQAQAKSFEKLGAYEWEEVNLTGNREPEKVQASEVTANFFGLLRAQPKMGRTF